MKKTFFLAGLVLSTFSLMGQTHHFNLFKKGETNKHKKLINGLIAQQSQQSSGTNQKPTGIQQRVVAQSLWSEGEGLSDSTKYVFSGLRTSRYNHNNAEDLNYNTEFNSDYFPNTIFPNAVNSIDLQADSIKNYDGTGQLDYTYKAFYRNDNKLDSFNSFNSWGGNNTTKILHLFNSNGYLTQVTELDENMGGGSFDTVYVHRYKYNSAGDRLLSDTLYDYSMGNLFLYSFSSYHYNVTNQLDTVTEFVNNGIIDTISSKIYLTYETGTNGRIRTVNSFYYDSDPTWNYGYADSFGYAAGTSTLYNFYQEYYLDETGNRQDGNKLIKTMGTNNLPDTIKAYYADVPGNWNLEIFAKYFYNSYNNPDSMKIYNIADTITMKQTFYYETFDDTPPVSIKDLKSNSNFNIYPNPFDNKINIDWKNAATKAKVSLINMVGQTVYTSNKSLVTGNNAMDIPATTSGTYILMIQDEKGNTFNQKLSKR